MRRLALFVALFTVLGAVVAGLGYLWLVHAPVADTGKKLLTLHLQEPLVEYNLARGLSLPGVEPRLTLASAYRGLSAARTDATVVGLALYLDDASMGLAKAQELRRQLLGMREAKKEVDCYLETAGEGGNGTLEYFLASACTSISLAPAGEINLLGLYLDGAFVRGGLDKLKIEPSFLHAGAFKSAAEIFTETKHSPAAREALDALLDGIYGVLVRDIAAGRALDEEAVRAAIDRAPLSAEEAREARLVDAVEYPDEFRAHVDGLGGSTRQVPLVEYASGVERRSASGPRIAVLFAMGAIVRGSGGTDPFSDESALGSTDISESLSSLAADDSVKAVVLRIDSPGGSALASDLILREVERLKEKKPVIVSMSDVAASGGYYIAAKANKIVAEEATITGSIGVVTGKLATGRFQQELLGVTHDPLARGANSALYSTLEPFNEAQTAVMRRRLDEIYERFLGHVAAGRGLARDTVAAIAEGRVWTGADARERGLVDELGGFDRAIALAREAAGIAPEAPITLAFYPKPETIWDWLTSRNSGKLEEALLARRLVRAALAAAVPEPRAELEIDPAFSALSHLE